MSQFKVSISSLGSYENCPRKYKFQYIDRLPRQSFEHLDVGNYVHEVLEYVHTDIQSPESPADLEETVRKYAKERWDGFKSKLGAESQTKSKALLKDYIAYVKRVGIPTVLATEQEFQFEVEPGLIMRGIVDRIDMLPDGRRRILDYKTGKSKYLDRFQIEVYGLHLVNAHPETESFVGSYLVLPEGPKEVSYEIAASELQATREEIIKQATDIVNDKTWDPKPSFLCNYCDFFAVCPDAYGKKSQQNDELIQIGKRTSF